MRLFLPISKAPVFAIRQNGSDAALARRSEGRRWCDREVLVVVKGGRRLNFWSTGSADSASRAEVVDGEVSTACARAPKLHQGCGFRVFPRIYRHQGPIWIMFHSKMRTFPTLPCTLPGPLPSARCARRKALDIQPFQLPCPLSYHRDHGPPCP